MSSDSTAMPPTEEGGPKPVTELLAVCLERLSVGEPLGLDELCAAHPEQADELRHRVDRLAALGLLDEDDEPGEQRRVGPFTLMGLLGAGGMGQVHLAQQSEPVRRLAAVKLMHAGMDAERLLRRFDTERQALAVLRHPGIAAVLEAGATDDGRPWFAMEYVDGRPLTDFCDERRLALRARVELFVQVCEAVTHAHQSGILHRDLKPGNVLVTEVDGRPLAKVIDFGLAKALDEQGLEEALLTQAGQVLGTPAYMSPEQAGVTREPVDLRTDVYALGVMLHELLVGALPLVPEGDGPLSLVEMQRLLAEREALPPSQAVERLQAGDRRELAARRDVAPERWSRALVGDLDWIVGKALAKSRDRRYAAVSALADDLRRHLAHEPVLASPPSTVYRLTRLLRRHRREAVVAGVGLLALLVALVQIVLSSRETERRIEQFDALAWRQDVDGLLERAEHELWPEVPAMLPAMQAWLAQAETLAAQRSVAAAIRDELEQRARQEDDGTRRFAEGRERYLHARILELLGRLDQLDGPAGAIADVRARMAWAADLERLTLDEPAAEWAAALDAIARSPRYDGLRITPQLGLLPLGPDPHSGLWEFAMPRPGAELPRLGPDGRWLIGEDTCLVFVLLPAGWVHQGAQCHDDQAPRFRPQLAVQEGGGRRVELAPFLLSRAEMTQAQWLRASGDEPSHYQPGENHIRDRTHPVETVSWIDARRELRRLGLELPTGAQWEYAARGGRDALVWRGEGDLPDATVANLADRTNLEKLGTLSGIDDWDEDYDDGFARHAPVASCRPNAFGLHDMVGNVWEWCLDPGLLYDAATPRAGDGLQQPGAPVEDDGRREMRGGSFLSTFKKSRPSFRFFQPRTSATYVIGVRPARRLEPGGDPP